MTKHGEGWIEGEYKRVSNGRDYGYAGLYCIKPHVGWKAHVYRRGKQVGLIEGRAPPDFEYTDCAAAVAAMIEQAIERGEGFVP